MLKSQDSSLVNRIRSIQRSDKSNKQCANCGDVGPVYICMDFLTFVCTECSGIHREMSHKVKSISMSNWSEEEVNSLERSGGNKRDQEVYLVSYDSEAFPRPNSLNRDLLKEFIRTKYVEKRWAGVRKAVVKISEQPEIIPDRPRKMKKDKKKHPMDHNDGPLETGKDNPTSVERIQLQFSKGFEALEKLFKQDNQLARELAATLIDNLKDQFMDRIPTPQENPTIPASNSPVEHACSTSESFSPRISNNPFDFLPPLSPRSLGMRSSTMPFSLPKAPLVTSATSSNPFDFLQ